MLEGLRREGSIAELSRAEDIASSMSYELIHAKKFLEAGEKRLPAHAARHNLGRVKGFFRPPHKR